MQPVQIDISALIQVIDTSLHEELREHYYLPNTTGKQHIKTKRFDQLFLSRAIGEAFRDLYSSFVVWRTDGTGHEEMFSNRLYGIDFDYDDTKGYSIADSLIPKTLAFIDSAVIGLLERLEISPYDMWSFRSFGSYVMCSLDGDFRIEDWERRTNAGEFDPGFKKYLDKPVIAIKSLGIDDASGKIIQ